MLYGTACTSEITVPDDFETWDRARQIHKVSQLRMKILRPDQFKKQTKRSSLRSRMTRKFDMVNKWKGVIERLRGEIEEAEVRKLYREKFLCTCR